MGFQGHFPLDYHFCQARITSIDLANNGGLSLFCDFWWLDDFSAMTSRSVMLFVFE
jgi:hypothetical protein